MKITKLNDVISIDFENDLLKPVQRKSKETKPVHYMTFKNIAKRGGGVCWQTGKRIQL